MGKNLIIASTTSQYNCGDKFILTGIKRIFREVGIDANWAIYDRNPDIIAHASATNSWKPSKLSPEDIFMIAGTPAWNGFAYDQIFSQIVNSNCSFWVLGIGTPNSGVRLRKDTLASLKLAQLLTSRDHIVADALAARGLRCDLFPCPALFASPDESVKSGNKVAVVWQSHQTHKDHSVDKFTSDLLLSLAKELQCDVIAHHFDECQYLRETNFHYSHDAIDYLEIYDQYDLIVSTRLHGSILATSLGVPTILINPSLRCAAASRLFPFAFYDSISLAELLKTTDEFLVETASREAIEFKRRENIRYVQYIKSKLSKVMI